MPRATDPLTKILDIAEVNAAIEDCPYVPLCTKVVVFVPPIEELSSGGILLASESARAKEHRAMVHGYLIAIGPEAWADYPTSSGLPRIGDRVSFGRFEGRMPDNDAEYRVMQDQDIDSLLIDHSEHMARRKPKVEGVSNG